MWYNAAMDTKEHSYSVQIEPVAEGGFWSRVPALPGCFSQGETIEETLVNTKEAIALYLEGLATDKEEIPEESAQTLNVRVLVTV